MSEFQIDVVAATSIDEALQGLVKTAEAIGVVAADFQKRTDALRVQVHAIKSANTALMAEVTNLQAKDAANQAEIERLTKLVGATPAPAPVPVPVPAPVPVPVPTPVPTPVPPPTLTTRTREQVTQLVLEEFAKQTSFIPGGSNGNATPAEIQDPKRAIQAWTTMMIDQFQALTAPEEQLRTILADRIRVDVRQGNWPGPATPRLAGSANLSTAD